MKHTHGVNSADFSSDGRWILTFGNQTNIHLWSTSTLKEIGMGMGYDDFVTSAAVAPGGKHILAATGDSVSLREIAADLDMPPDLFKLQVMAITGVVYDFQTNETKTIPLVQWYKLKEQYDEQAEKHFKNCKYRRYNLWQGLVYKKTER
jgi:WD40 repeat protein